jgi:uncharacterized protein
LREFTKPTIAAVRDRTHWNSPNIKPRHPVELGLCTYAELEQALNRAHAKKPTGEGVLGGEEAEQLEA